MENVSPASSKGSKRGKILKNKSFMARLSSALLLNHPKHGRKTQNDQQSHPDQKELDTPSKNMNVAREPFETIENSQGIHSGYATVCDIIQASDESGEEAPPPVPPKSFDDPKDLYSKVNKKKVYLDVGCNTDKLDFAHAEDHHNDASAKNCDTPNESVKDMVPIQTTPKKVWNNQTKRCLHRSGQERLSSTIKKIKLYHQRELKHLRHEMQAVILRNESLKKQVKELLEKEKKWKEEISIAMTSQQNSLHIIAKNSDLNEKISKLEFDTRQEVQLLCEKVKHIRREKDELLNEFAALSEERNLLQQKCDKMNESMQNMISVKTHTKEIKIHQKSEQEMKRKYEKEINDGQEKYNKLEDEKNSNSVKVRLLNDEKEKFQTENHLLKENQKELIESKERQAEHVAKLIEKDQQHYELVLSMYTLLKNMSAEREVIIKKSQFQDEKQKQLQSAYESQCYKFGQLEQYVAEVEEEMGNRVHATASKAHETELNHSRMKHSHEAQLEILRRKIRERDLVIDNLKDQKKKLESDFENLWLTFLQEKKISGQTLERNELTGKITKMRPKDS